MTDNVLIEQFKMIADANAKRGYILEIGDSISEKNEYFELLTYALKDGDAGVKDLCSRLLSESPEEYAFIAANCVAPLIGDTNIEVRNLAGEILSHLGKASVEALRPYLKVEDVDVIKFACDILGLIGNNSVLEEVYPLLDSSDDNVVCSSIDTIGIIGDETSIDKLAKCYSGKYEWKPNIIESLGKIGGAKANHFLEEQLNSCEDDFIKTTIIDALAVCCDDIAIAERLLSDLHESSPQIQPLLLKTIFAIAYRLDIKIELPQSMRYVAGAALKDDDPDVRTAGLISLGDRYYEQDIEPLIYLSCCGDPDMQMMIIYNLIVNSSEDVISKFFELYCTINTNTGAANFDVEFLSLLANLWDDVDEEKKSIVTLIIISTLSKLNPSDSAMIIDLLIKIDGETALEALLAEQHNYGEDFAELITETLKRE